MNLGLRPGEKGSGETGYQIVVTCVLNNHANYYINEYSLIHKQNAGSFCREVEIVIFFQSFTFTHGLRTLFAKTQIQFQNQKGEWVWAMERYTHYWISD